MAIYEALDIRKERIDPRQSWQNYREAHLYVMWNLENSLHNLHYVDLTLDSYGVFKVNERQFHIIGIMRRLADYSLNKAPTLDEMKKAHRKFIRDYNTQIHGCRTGSVMTIAIVRRRVLRGVLARTLPAPTLARIFFATEFTRHEGRDQDISAFVGGTSMQNPGERRGAFRSASTPARGSD